MTGDRYEFADLNEQAEAVHLIKQTEEKLSKHYGSPVTLIAYEEKKPQE